jgi:thiamine kinase-like enzyme
MNKIRFILQEKVQLSDWTISKPKDGQQKECYIAHSGNQSVFMKFDIPVPLLQRLGQIEVAPRVFASGDEDGRSYVIQEYISGNYPERAWFTHHLTFLAQFMKRFHEDQQLLALLSKSSPANHREHISQEIEKLEAQLHTHTALLAVTPEVLSAFQELKDRSTHLQPVQLVPIHPDPNTKNMLLLRKKLFMVDWDDIQLSDPLRDIGLLLWWYVRQENWPSFFQAYGLPYDDLLLERLFWWTARASLAITFWLIEQKQEPTHFLQDFLAAIQKDDNPHGAS